MDAILARILKDAETELKHVASAVEALFPSTVASHIRIMCSNDSSYETLTRALENPDVGKQSFVSYHNGKTFLFAELWKPLTSGQFQFQWLEIIRPSNYVGFDGFVFVAGHLPDGRAQKLNLQGTKKSFCLRFQALHATDILRAHTDSLRQISEEAPPVFPDVYQGTDIDY